MVFVAPNPKLKPKFFALVWPLQTSVWVFVFVSLVVATVIFTLVSNIESKAMDRTGRDPVTNILPQVIGKSLKTWSTTKASVWFVFATMIGESDTRKRDSVGAQATRILFGVWILYCFVISASYSGSLKAFLTTPEYGSPIDTLRDVLESGLPWGMVLYGEEEEMMMANSPLGSDIRTIWDGKIIKPYSPTVAEVDSVMAGKSIFIDWKSGLEPAIFSASRTPLIKVEAR